MTGREPAPQPDLAVVGAGVAGLTAALAARQAGLVVTLLESAASPGGQLRRIYAPPRGVPGMESGEPGPAPPDGEALAIDLVGRLAAAGTVARTHAGVSGLETGTGRSPELKLDDGSSLAAHAVLIATGLRPRTLDVPGERALAGAGVSTSATRDRQRFAGRPVVVVGGGDAAFENALLLAEVGCPVTLLVRGEPRARAEFRRRVSRVAGIEVLRGARVLEILGAARVEGVRMADARGERTLPAGGVFVKVGAVPNTEWCRPAVACDPDGYVRVDARGATSAPGVWAAGDVTRPAALTLAEAAAGAGRAVAAIVDARRGA